MIQLASSNDLSAKRPNRLFLKLPANILCSNSQNPSARKTGFVRNSVTTTVQDQTDLATLDVETMLPLDQSSEGVEGAQAAEEETEMDLAAAARSWQVMLAVEKTLDPDRVGAEVCQESAWRADVVV